MAWEENSRICLHMQLIAILSRIGVDFLIDCYAAEHTLSIEDAVEDIMLLCQKNGGRVGC